jgi:hypothetical protein
MSQAASTAVSSATGGSIGNTASGDGSSVTAGIPWYAWAVGGVAVFIGAIWFFTRRKKGK